MSLPNFNKDIKENRIWLFFQILAGLASIIGIVQFEKLIPAEYSGLVYAVFLIALTSLSLLYVYHLRRKKLHRYCEAIQHTHYVNHKIRDLLAKRRIAFLKKKYDLLLDSDAVYEVLPDVLNSIAYAFSLITGNKCDVCIKEFQSGSDLKVMLRDPLAMGRRGMVDQDTDSHDIECDTPCHDVFYGQPGHESYYGCNDVPSEWKHNKYKSPSFAKYGKPPRTFRICGYDVVQNWNLPYKSCLVVPIRYTPTAKRPSKKNAHPRPPDGDWVYYGFLCIDCNHRNVFDFNRSVDLALAFADVLFVLFCQLEVFIDMATTEESRRKGENCDRDNSLE